MPKVTEAYLEARRQQVLDAAMACFARKGFHETTMQDICREAGLSPGAVYRYFSSKEDIVEACCIGTEQRSLMLIAAASEYDDTLAVLDSLAEYFFNLLAEEQSAPGMRLEVQLWAEALRNPRILEIYRRSLNRVHGPLTQIIRRAQERGEIGPALDAGAVARVMIAMWEGLVLQMGFEPDVDIQRYLAAVKALYSGQFWRGPSRAEDSRPW